jgi:Predicted acid phosphatase
MNGIPAIAFSNKFRDELTVANRYMPELARELIELGQQPGEIWNVNFPGGTFSELRGILRNRFIAPMQLYNGVYSARQHPEGHLMISQQGVPIDPGVAPEGSDIAAVLDGYISIGKIMSPVMCAGKHEPRIQTL